jgi:hypothetical protein
MPHPESCGSNEYIESPSGCTTFSDSNVFEIQICGVESSTENGLALDFIPMTSPPSKVQMPVAGAVCVLCDIRCRSRASELASQTSVPTFVFLAHLNPSAASQFHTAQHPYLARPRPGTWNGLDKPLPD